MKRANPDDKKALNAMRALLARGLWDEETLVNHAADVLGGGEAAVKTAQRVFDNHLKISGAA